MKRILILLLILQANYGYSQNGQFVNIAPLKPGDTLPELPMEKVLLNGKVISLNSKDFKDKLLILDFWDTWCTSCIESFPKLDLLQKTYKDKIQIISATYQKESVIRDFKSKNAFAKALSLPMLVDDTLFKSYFPYRSVPHTVWINKGKVIAIVGNEYLGKKMIEKVLRGDKINLPVKNDYLSYDFKGTSILGSVVSGKGSIWSAITGFNPNAGEQLISSTVDSVNGTVKDVFLNREIVRLYLGIFHDIKKRGYVLKPDMIFVESASPERYDTNYKKSEEFTQDWMIKNAICYESVLPMTLTKKQRAEIMIADLNNKLGLYGRMEMKPHKVYVIKELEGAKPAYQPEKDGQSRGKLGFKLFLNSVIYNSLAPGEGFKAIGDISPIIDDYNRADKQIEVYGYHDFLSLKRVLNLNGLDIVEENRPIEVFVLSEIRN